MRILQILPTEFGVLPVRPYMGILRDVVPERTARAESNAELVEEIANAAENSGRRVAAPERAREILGIK